jgi:hypothetical protein
MWLRFLKRCERATGEGRTASTGCPVLTHQRTLPSAARFSAGLQRRRCLPGGVDPAPIEPSNNAETADEDFVDGLDAGTLELGSFCRNGVYPDAAAATGWQASAVAPQAAPPPILLDEPLIIRFGRRRRMICLIPELPDPIARGEIKDLLQDFWSPICDID